MSKKVAVPNFRYYLSICLQRLWEKIR